MSDETDLANPSNAGPKLSCLGDRAGPPTLGGDIAAFLALPTAAQERFWDVLEPCLDPALSADVDRAVEAFARKHEAVSSRVALALRGCRFLFFEAARRAVDKLTFAADLARLAGGDDAERFRAVILRGYENAMRALRADILRRTIAEHGSLLTAIDWRVDRILGSQHGHAIDAPLGVLTLTFKTGAEQQRVTLHCEPSMLQRLRTACDDMLR